MAKPQGKKGGETKQGRKGGEKGKKEEDGEEQKRERRKREEKGKEKQKKRLNVLTLRTESLTRSSEWKPQHGYLQQAPCFF